jgi:uncharacterized protein (DUF2141 family)
MRGFAALLLALALVAATAPSASVEVDLTALRSSRGMIQMCLTRSARHFPDCQGDPHAIRRTVPASVRQLTFDVPAGRYALSVFHDENANRKLDTLAGIPKEGFGFSQNPKIRFGPPRFDKVSMELAPGFTRTSVRMQYVL